MHPKNFHLLLNHDTMYLIRNFLNPIDSESIRSSCRYFCSIIPHSRFNLDRCLFQNWSRIINLIKYIDGKSLAKNIKVSISVNKATFEIDFNNNQNDPISINYVTGWIEYKGNTVGHIHQDASDWIQIFTTNPSLPQPWIKVSQRTTKRYALKRIIAAFLKKYSTIDDQVHYCTIFAFKAKNTFGDFLNLRVHTDSIYFKELTQMVGEFIQGDLKDYNDTLQSFN